MLIIRRAQLDTFAKAAVQKFEDRMVVHLTELFPEQCGRWGQPKIRDAVQHGIRRAASYGLTGERTVCKYVEMMFHFGIDFDVDPEFPWVAWILKQPTSNSERTIDYVYETALEKRAQTSHTVPHREFPERPASTDNEV